jgi:hypothetical protein
MTSVDTSQQWKSPEDDELVRRLRSLDWPEVSPELRKRCWEEFSGRLTDQNGRPAASAARALGERYAFSRRLVPSNLRPVAGARMAIAAGLSRSSGPRQLLHAA